MKTITSVSELTSLEVDGDLHVVDCADPLPDGLTVNGSLTVERCRARYLPADLTVSDSLFIDNCAFIEMPRNSVVGWSLHIVNCPNLREIPAMTVKGNLKVIGCSSLTEFQVGVRVHGDRVVANCPALRELPMDWFSVQALTLDGCQRRESMALRRCGKLTVVDCPRIRALPDRLRVGELELEHCPGLVSLGRDLVVERGVYLNDCANLAELGDVHVREDLTVRNCPRLNVDGQDHRVRGKVRT